MDVVERVKGMVELHINQSPRKSRVLVNGEELPVTYLNVVVDPGKALTEVEMHTMRLNEGGETVIKGCIVDESHNEYLMNMRIVQIWAERLVDGEDQELAIPELKKALEKVSVLR